MPLTREVTRPFGEIGFDLPGRAARPPMPWTWQYEKPDGEVVPPNARPGAPGEAGEGDDLPVDRQDHLGVRDANGLPNLP